MEQTLENKVVISDAGILDLGRHGEIQQYLVTYYNTSEGKEKRILFTCKESSDHMFLIERYLESGKVRDIRLGTAREGEEHTLKRRLYDAAKEKAGEIADDFGYEISDLTGHKANVA